ncbi:peptidase domain-containing ABC transporter [Muribaculaceae bacterium Isolate-113 (HZI)]|uniref:peptidase domain-containing ABC transporter n=1 Tax=Bacteroides acidifaciens TaxID=85831 RepID=UPI000F470FA4|nr:peptidase domain-containing ABC transporter [Bacteroides acidifaciens]ROT17876.1 peptidase domain-containing ABC transporter [Muribaculaceae bacterium Isolate-114 (HZI)]ROT18813.1 peptidase domain-containing ABC transporter [Muribaculaceae bacterium Isolate-113 (HZI)]
MKSFPWIKQKDAMQCGSACLAMICMFHGQKRNLNEISKICRPSISGISVNGIEEAAEKLGLKADSRFIPYKELTSISHPVILHWNQNHFVILFKVSKNGKKFYVSDPGKGISTYSHDEFRKHWVSTIIGGEENGVVISLLPTKDFNRDKIMNDPEPRSLKFLALYLKEYKKHFIQIILGLLLGCVLQLILPFLTQSIVDIGINHNDIGFIWLIMLGELMIVIGRTSTDFIRRWLLLHISMRINISLVSDFFIKLLKLPMCFFDTKLMGDLLQRIGDHTRVQNFLTGQVLNIIFTFLSFIIFGVVLFIYNPLIFGIFAIGSMCYGVWITIFLNKRKFLDYELFEQQAKNQDKTYQFITSIQEIKLQDCEQRRRWEWEDTQAELFNVQMKSLKLQQAQEAGSIFINEIKNIIITVLAATAVINNQMTLGAMLAIQYIIGQLNSPVSQLMSFIYSFQDVKISLERINEIHEGKNEETSKNQLTYFKSKKTIRIENIDFKYDPYSLRKILNNISLCIPEGKVTAIVGASGSGKTTLIKLMLGYYPVLSGEISIAGRDINEYNLKWWRRHCGVVMQDGVIFSESIARNIAVDDGDIDENRLINAARIANIHEYIMGLPLKYNTQIGRDGVGLSQGQKQRILIARAVYKNPDFIFLDEATNALDAKNERAIVENLDEFYKGRTVVVVAHRLSTVKNADQIIVLDGGRVVETGNHTSLIEKKGAYYNLVKNQLELGN